MSDLILVAHCGLYCGVCAHRNRIPGRARSLQDAMRKEGYDFWGNDIPGFDAFWKFPGDLARSEESCTCRGGHFGPPFFVIRKCATSQGIALCPLCDEHSCHRVRGIAGGYPTLLADGARMKERGLEAWIAAQEQRAKTGFAYADIRVHPYGIPE